MITEALLMIAYQQRFKAKTALKAKESMTISDPMDEARIAYIDADNAVKSIRNTLNAMKRARLEQAS